MINVNCLSQNIYTLVHSKWDGNENVLVFNGKDVVVVFGIRIRVPVGICAVAKVCLFFYLY